MRIVLCMFVCGCYTSTLYTPTARPEASPDEITDASIEMEVIRERESGRLFETTFRDMRQALRRELPRSHGFRARGQGDVRIELRLDALEVRTENAGSRTAMLAMCAVVLLFPACAFIGSTPREVRQLSTTWTLEVFDADDASIVLERHQTLTRAGIGRMTPAESLAFEREIATDAARQLIRATRNHIRQALRSRNR